MIALISREIPIIISSSQNVVRQFSSLIRIEFDGGVTVSILSIRTLSSNFYLCRSVGSSSGNSSNFFFGATKIDKLLLIHSLNITGADF